MSINIETVDRDHAHPYGRSTYEYYKMYEEVIEKVGDLKPEDMLRVELTSSSAASRFKKRIIKAYPELGSKLEMFSLQEGKVRPLYIRFKKNHE